MAHNFKTGDVVRHTRGHRDGTSKQTFQVVGTTVNGLLAMQVLPAQAGGRVPERVVTVEGQYYEKVPATLSRWMFASCDAGGTNEWLVLYFKDGSTAARRRQELLDDAVICGPIQEVKLELPNE